MRARAADAAQARALEVAEAKIRVPHLNPGLVSRTGLVNRLRANKGFPVVAITAPGGYGKTTLLAQWADRDARPFAWVSVDSRDADPIFLLRHVAAALHAIRPLDPEVAEALADPGRSMWTSALPRLGAALSSFPEPLVIVLDDAHLLSSRDALEAVGVLIDHLPAGAALVFAGRHAPKLSIAVLRAEGRLFELDAGQLALTPREGQAVLRSVGLDLPFADVTSLVRDCEGWPVAVYLAALTLGEGERRVRREGEPLRVNGSDANLAGYIRSEYLSKLRPGALRFLRRTAILEKMCGGICDAVLDDRGSGRELEQIERSNMFLVPLDGERVWYRYHRLFRDVLRRELAESEPRLVPLLHRRAARWYEAREDLESAIEHARAAGDLDRVARILTTIAQPLYNSGRVATVERWLARFNKPGLLERYPAVALHGSWVHARRGRSVEAERWLEIGELAIAKRRPSRQTAVMHAWASVIRASLCGDGVYQMIADAESALSQLPRNSSLRPSALIALGAGHLLLGHSRRADAIFAEAAGEAARFGATDSEVLAIGERSIIASARNDASTADRLALEAHALVERSGLDGYGTTAIARTASARAALRRGRWDDARTELGKADELASRADRGCFPWFVLQSRIELARAYLALRETAAVRSQLSEIRLMLGERPHVGVLADEAAALEREVEAIPELDGPRAALTPAELRLLPLLATQLSFREIGEQLYVSRNTIKTQAISVYRKLGVASRSGAIDCAASLGLIEARPPEARPFIQRG
jgi:LuxR family transcriptional regulator, maltose regulon positive regulatory protein